MRVLATIAFSFSFGIFASALLPWDGWQLYAAAVCIAAGIVACFFHRKKAGKRIALMAFSLCAALLYHGMYQSVFVTPALQSCGKTTKFGATVIDWAEATDYGAKVTVKLDGKPSVKAVYYGDVTLLETEPGNRISGTARWQDATNIKGTEITYFSARDTYILLYDEGDFTIADGEAGSLRYLPQRVNRAFQEKIRTIWPNGRINGLLTAMLTGDRGNISDADYTAMKEVGLAHLFAVSGLHCAFLVTLVLLFIPAIHRRLGAAITIGVLLFYMCMVGLTPSVVRACIMQIFLLTAPLFKRDSDGLTAISAALFVILLCNPNAAASVSLQLSFAATLGMILWARKIYDAIRYNYRGKNRLLQGFFSFVAANLAVTLAAMILTTPLVAYYFNTLALITPLSSLLIVPAAGWSFMTAFVTTLIGFVSLPAAQVMAAATTILLRYVLWMTELLMQVPYHAVSFSNRYLRWWLAFTYGAFGLCYVTKEPRRKYGMAASLSILLFLLCGWYSGLDRSYGTLNLLALDVGQGESVAIYDDTAAVLIDCGSSNTGIRAGTVAADELIAAGIRNLDAVVVTHYHADHTNGLFTLLTRVDAEHLYLPDIEDEYGVREKLEQLAQKKRIPVTFVTDLTTADIGSFALTLYPPLGEGDMNEQGLSVVGSSGDFDVLVTGDMSASTEQALIATYPVPDIEALLVSHHGSRSASDLDFLQAITPETAIISVGENSYGHPTRDTLLRLDAVGAKIYRTDESGHIRLTVHGGT